MGGKGAPVIDGSNAGNGSSSAFLNAVLAARNTPPRSNTYCGGRGARPARVAGGVRRLPRCIAVTNSAIVVRCGPSPWAAMISPDCPLPKEKKKKK